MTEADEAAFRAFAWSRRSTLRRTAYLLCGDWHQADDLVQTALVKLYVAWKRVRSGDAPDAYARRTLLRCYLDERRRPWRREVPVEVVDDFGSESAAIADRLDLLSALATLPARQRATIVLRFWVDASVSETAEALNCSEGTVKSQTARAIERLRHLLADPALVAVSEEPCGRRSARRRTALVAVAGGAATATVAAAVAVPLLLDNGPGSKPGTIRVGARPSPSAVHLVLYKRHGGLAVCWTPSTVTPSPSPTPSSPSPSQWPSQPPAPRYHYTESPQSISARLGEHLAARVASFGLPVTYTRPFAQESSAVESGHPPYYDGNVDVRESHGYGDIGVQVTHKAASQVSFHDPCPATGPNRCQQTTLPDGSVLRTGRVPAGGHDVVLTAEVARPDGVVVQAQESNYPFGPDAGSEAHGAQPLSIAQLVSLAKDPKFSF